MTVAVARVVQDRISALFVFLSRTVLLAAAVVAPTLVALQGSPGLGRYGWLAATAGTVLAAAPLVAIVYAPHIFSRLEIRQRFAVSWQLSCLAGIAGGASWLLVDQASRLDTVWVFVATSALVAVWIGGTANFVLGLAIALAMSLARRRTRYHHPDAIICQELINVLWHIQRYGHTIAHDFGFRHYLVLSIEKAASFLEHDLPKRLASGDHGTSTWLAGETKRAAAVLRSAKRPILGGGAAELASAVTPVRAVLRAVADGGWRHLEGIPLTAEPVSEPPSVRERARIVLGVIWRISLPVALFVGLQVYDGLDPSFRIPAQSMIVVFIVVLLLPVVDPNGDKLRLMKEIAQFLRLPSSGWNSGLAPPNESDGAVARGEPDTLR